MTTRSDNDLKRTFSWKYPERVGFAKTRSGSVIMSHTQSEADRVAAEIDSDKSRDIGTL